MAGALGLQLCGPQVYDGETHEAAFIGEGRREANAADVRRALGLYRTACLLGWVTLLLAALA